MDEPMAETPTPSEENAPEAVGAVSGDAPLGAIPGADRAALGMTPPAGLEPTTAQVDPTFFEPPSAFDEQTALREAKPWATSLAYQSPQVGVDADEVGDEQGHVGRAQGEGVPPDQP